MSPAKPLKDAFRSLLVPVDLSPLSDRVVGRAVSLPIAAGGTVTLLHGLSRDQEKAHRLRLRHDGHGVAVIEEHQESVPANGEAPRMKRRAPIANNRTTLTSHRRPRSSG